MAIPMSSSCWASSLRVVPFKRTLFPSVHYPAKTLILRPLRPSGIPSICRTIITSPRISNKIVPPPSASSSPSSSADHQFIDELPPKLQEIVKLFQSVEDPKAKYEQLLFYGKNLKPLDSQFKTSENKVAGCVSQVWVRAFLDEELNVVYEADSDSVITKGLAALLVNGLSGTPVPEILRITPDCAVLLGLQQSLSPSRNNGFLNMLRLMQMKAAHLAEKAEGDASSGESLESSNVVFAVLLGLQQSLNMLRLMEKKAAHLAGDTPSGEGSESSFASTPKPNDEASVLEADSKPSLIEDQGTEKVENPESGSNIADLGSRWVTIRVNSENELNPVEVKVEDVSYQHGGETHFNLQIVSDAFQDKNLVKRHKMIYNLVQEELQSGLHALSIVAKTPAEV